MSVKTVRFNKKEEALLRKVLVYYRTDFSSCIKELLLEKIEDLQDMKVIKTIREGKREDYVSADKIDKLF